MYVIWNVKRGKTNEFLSKHFGIRQQYLPNSNVIIKEWRGNKLIKGDYAYIEDLQLPIIFEGGENEDRSY